MSASLKKAGEGLFRRIPIEFTTIAAFALAIFGVVCTGAAICANMPSPAPWAEVAAAYGGPGSIAFSMYWLISRRL